MKHRISCKPSRYTRFIMTVSLILPLVLHIAYAEVKKWLRDEIHELKEQLKEDRGNVKLLMDLAERYGWAKMPDEAIETYERVLAVDPDNMKAMKALKDFYSWNHMPEKALSVMEKMSALRPDDLEIKKEMARRYGWMKKQERAIELYEEVLEEDPGNVDVRKRLSDLYRWNRMKGKAIEQYVEIIKLDKNDLATRRRLAFSYSWNDRPFKAIQLFEEYLSAEPGDHDARKQLAHLYYYNDRPADAIEQYRILLDAGVYPEGREMVRIYGKMGNAYRRIKDYDHALDYYRQLLDIAPESVEAREWVREVERALRPRIYSEVIFRKTKGDARRLYQRYGFSQMLDDGYSMDAGYRHLRRTEPGERRLITQAADIEISKDISRGLTFFSGASLLYYGSNERVRFEYFTRFVKELTERVTGEIYYRKRVEDSDFGKLHQNVNRHRLTTRMRCEITDRLDLDTAVRADYLTEGNAPDNNMGWGLSVSPSFRLMEEPHFTFSYTYFRAEYLRKDNVVTDRSFGGGVFDYFNPRLYYFHAGSLYLSHELVEDRVRLILSDRLYYAQDEDDVNYLGNIAYGEIRARITDRDTVTLGYNRSRILWHVPDSYQIDQRIILRFSHDF